jgi:hypothetical protein
MNFEQDPTSGGRGIAKSVGFDNLMLDIYLGFMREQHDFQVNLCNFDNILINAFCCVF